MSRSLSHDLVTATGIILVFIGVIIFYFHSIDFRLFMEGWNEYLESGSVEVSDYIPAISILDVVGESLLHDAFMT